MAQQFRELTVLTEDSSSVPRTYIRRPITAHYSSCRDSNTSPNLLKHLHSCAHVHMHTQTRTQLKISKTNLQIKNCKIVLN